MNNEKLENLGTVIMVTGRINTDSITDCENDGYILANVCFCKERSNVVLEKLIQHYRISEYQGMELREKGEDESLIVMGIDMNEYKGMQLTGTIADFIDNDPTLLKCKIDNFDINELRETILNIDINDILYEKEFVEEVKNDLTQIYNKLK
jgi:hypothetical protein